MEPPGPEAAPRASEPPAAAEPVNPAAVEDPVTTAPHPPPSARDAVARAHRIPRTHPDRTGYLRLDLGEFRSPASPKVLQALRALTAEELATYPDPAPLAARLASLHGVPRSSVTVTAGTDEAIRWTFNAFVEAGARVLLPRPTFGAFLAAAEAGGAFVGRIDYPDDLRFPTEAFADRLRRRPPRLTAISNPNGPTGTAIEREELLGLAVSAPDTLFFINETYGSFHGSSLLDDGAGASLPANVLVVRSFSKDYGLAGLRVGWMVGHPEVIRAIDHVRPSFTVSVAAIAAASAALDDPESVVERVRRVRLVMDRLVARLEERRITAVATRANFVLVRLSAPIQPWAAALAAHGILVGTSGHVGPLAACIRVTVAAEEEIQRFLDALDLVLAQGIAGAAEVRGVRGAWEDLADEGLG